MDEEIGRIDEGDLSLIARKIFGNGTRVMSTD